MRYEAGDFVQHMRSDPKNNAWRCCGVVTRGGSQEVTVAWLDFDRQAYSLVWPPQNALRIRMENGVLFPLEPEKCIMPIADEVFAEAMKLRMGVEG